MAWIGWQLAYRSTCVPELSDKQCIFGISGASYAKFIDIITAPKRAEIILQHNGMAALYLNTVR